MKIHLNIKISGQVQGVFFRVSAKKEADILNLKGFAKNEDDGSVYIEIEGEENSITKFISWCKKGPALAKVENINTQVGKIQNFKDFKTL